MIIDCVSDLHGYFPELEGGDILILAGDYTSRDSQDEYFKFFAWVELLPYRKKIMIAGNHDNEMVDEMYSGPEFDYLCDSGTEFEGLKIWGSPWTKKFSGMNPKCMAFTVDKEQELMNKFELIPHKIDILITHSPAYSVLDKVIGGYSVGSGALYNWIKYVERPRLHVFGHVHEAYGKTEVFSTYEHKMMISVNASHVNERYQPVNAPIRIEL